jgi:hypothetical protein
MKIHQEPEDDASALVANCGRSLYDPQYVFVGCLSRNIVLIPSKYAISKDCS